MIAGLEQVEKKEKIHLYVDNTGTSDSVVKLRWCICPEVYEMLREDLVEDPYLLLVIVHNNQEKERRLIPLGQMMEYVAFYGSGSHKIFATIVWLDVIDVKNYGEEFKKYYLSKDRQKRFNHVLIRDGDRFDDYTPHYARRTGEVMIEINVSRKFFAKKVSARLERWVSLWRETLPRDQCQFRGRCFHAFTFQPLMVGAYIIFFVFIRSFLAFYGLLLGMRQIGFSPIIHPFKSSTKEVLEHTDDSGAGSIFVTNKEGRERSLFILPFIPIVLLFLSEMSFAVNSLFYKVTIWSVSKGVLVGILLIWTIILMLYAISFIARFFPKGKKKESRKEEQTRAYEEFERAEEHKERQRIEQWEKAYSPLVCEGEPVEPSLNALPKTHRTFYLRFQDFKARVCRPFAEY